MNPVFDLAEFLRGGWTIERSLTDRTAGLHGTFSGQLIFTDIPGGLHSHEYGEMRWPTHQGPASRDLNYTIAEPGVAQVHFRDGHFFHELDLRTGSCTVTHPCGADNYVGEFTVDSPREWRWLWNVRGPNKDLEIRTELHRCG